MSKYEFVQLAHTYDCKKHTVNGWFLSEKLDGMRALWDGGVSRGLACKDVPYANTEKHDRYITKPVATGLWTRYGQPIQAPDWWLDALPRVPMDGELTMGRGTFQRVMSCVKQLIPDSRWSQIQYAIFDLPNPFVDGKLTGTNFKKTVVGSHQFAMSRGLIPQSSMFEQVLFRMSILLAGNKVAYCHPQERLPYTTKETLEVIEKRLSEIVEAGGEGVMLRNPIQVWKPERVYHMLKYKPFQDSEATVIGYTWGRETDLGSKLLGLMGALVVTWKGKTFELSGFTDAERVMVFKDSGQDARGEGIKAPGQRVAEGIVNPRFMPSSTVTFKYRELTDDGIPKEARFWRKAT